MTDPESERTPLGQATLAPSSSARRPVVLVAATGGHLAQLSRLVNRLDIASAPRVWVTFDGPQSRSVLAGEDVVYVPYVAPRDLAAALRGVLPAGRLLRSRRPIAVISTGSGVAMSYLPIARVLGVPTMYIESAARAEGPSLTGKMLQRVPNVKLGTQYPSWSGPRWAYVGSVFDEFVPMKSAASGELRRVVVTLGTIKGFQFRAAVTNLMRVIPAGVEVLWQVGDTSTDDLDIQAVRSMPGRDLDAALRTADVVIAHSGIGSCVAALEAGRCPLLLPRRAAAGEHVDDHQQQIAAELSRRGLARVAVPEALTLEDLLATRSTRIERTAAPPVVRTGLLG